MGWTLNSEISQVGESPSDDSKIGFRGTRFAIGAHDEVFQRDYYDPILEENIRKYHSDSESYVETLRKEMGDYWDGRFRIRGNGDTYCVNRSGSGWTYVGRTDVGSTESFEGYCLGASSTPGADPDSPVSLYSGSHNHGQVGERWTITPDWFQDLPQNNALGNVGVRMKRNDWIWSESDDSKFISFCRSAFRFERENFLRVYINCCGWVIRPLKKIFWEDEGAYGIDIEEQINSLSVKYPMAAKSAEMRLMRAEEGSEATMYFVCGHIREMGGLPKPDLSDWRVKTINQEKSKWS